MLCTTYSPGWDPPTQVGPTHVSGCAQVAHNLLCAKLFPWQKSGLKSREKLGFNKEKSWSTKEAPPPIYIYIFFSTFESESKLDGFSTSFLF